MRTTLSLDSDVEKLIERYRARHQVSLKETVNTALRRGLNELNQPSGPPSRFETRTVDLGGCRLNQLDDVADALALAEGDGFK